MSHACTHVCVCVCVNVGLCGCVIVSLCHCVNCVYVRACAYAWMQFKSQVPRRVFFRICGPALTIVIFHAHGKPCAHAV